MKHFSFTLLAVLVALTLTACSKKKEPQKWEYKTLEIIGEESAGSYSDFVALRISIPTDEEMDSLGNAGWELVDVYTRVGTAHPNFGNDKYVTGLQPNVRTTIIYYVFKRPKQEKDEEESKEKKDSTSVDSLPTSASAAELPA